MTLVSELHARSFITTGNEHGLSTTATRFRYFVDGAIVTGEYQGGEIVVGKIVGSVTGPSAIALLFQCVTANGTLLCGQSTGTVSRANDGLLRLDFDWQWLNGDRSGRKSSYIETAS